MPESTARVESASTPQDVITIQQAAVSWLSLQTYSRYEDILAVTKDFRAKLVFMADATVQILDAAPDRGLAEMRLAEARQAVEKNSYGSGLKGADDYSRRLANLLLSLCDIHQKATDR